VAVKVVHADLAGDDEFRRRFRSEVQRARQVPPFCTAELLDADPDASRPYLVVEYVDGPSLAEAVEERGPLTVANLHAVAIGVATALTAIHGAGIVHRDLKPRNVLLAPGSPKVIDFGIARALEATSQYTRTGQLVGTVAYMAPERFANEPNTPLTPAADIFAWGCVVAYAGTGRTPFNGDSPAATAARILTQPPDLRGLSGPLRHLVELSLAADPRDRPTARDLLTLLLDTGSPQFPQLMEALDRQPVLRSAANEMHAVAAGGSRPRGTSRRRRSRSSRSAPPRRPWPDRPLSPRRRRAPRRGARTCASPAEPPSSRVHRPARRRRDARRARRGRLRPRPVHGRLRQGGWLKPGVLGVDDPVAVRRGRRADAGAVPPADR
jgi:serine/threonine protein kinase